MATFIIAYIDWFGHELILEKHQGKDWREAVVKHSKIRSGWFDPEAFTSERTFKKACFDQDCMMAWIEI